MNANPYRCLVHASVGLCLRSVVTACLEVRSSSRTSTSTRNPRRTPGHSYSTRKSRDRFDSQTDYAVRFSQPFTPPLPWRGRGGFLSGRSDDMEAIDELISAAQTFYEDACANENGRSRSWEHCYRVFRDARIDPSPDCDYLSLHLAFYLASWGMYRARPSSFRRTTRC